MHVLIASCWKYRDAWSPFLALFRKFWTDCPYPVTLLTDRIEPGMLPEGVSVHVTQGTWCKMVAHAAANIEGPILLMQEDFFINAPVRLDLVEHALAQMKRWNAGVVRLYPCPGANAYYDDDHVGFVGTATDYRISCQASIWDSEFLREIASPFNSPWEFEIKGTPLSEKLNRHVLAWRRESEPWPMSYYCSAISRAKWEPAALEFCRQQKIEVDLSLRGIA